MSDGLIRRKRERASHRMQETCDEGVHLTADVLQTSRDGGQAGESFSRRAALVVRQLCVAKCAHECNLTLGAHLP